MIRRFCNCAATAATATFASVLMLFLSSCSSTSVDSSGLPTHLPDIHLSGSTATPPHSMASYEYPFDSNGRYVSAWAAEGERRAGRSANATKDDSSKWSKSHSGSRSSSSPKVAIKSTGKSKSTTGARAASSKSKSNDESADAGKIASKSKPKTTGAVAASSKGKSEDESTDAGKITKADTSTSGTSSKAKPASAKSGRSYTVKKGDTLSAIAARNGTTVAKIKAASGLSSDFLSIGKVLRLP